MTWSKKLSARVTADRGSDSSDSVVASCSSCYNEFVGSRGVLDDDLSSS